MKTLKILVQFQFADDTRWPFGPEAARKLLRHQAEVVGKVMTEGPEPQVTAVLEESAPQPQPHARHD